MDKAGTITIRSVGSEPPVYWLPCKIAYDGPADVVNNFSPQRQVQSDGSEMLVAHFRGRELRGCQRPLPDGYYGTVLQPSSAAEADGRTWSSTARFTSLTYFKHDDAPAPADGAQRCLDWLALADKLHAAVPVEDVETELEARQSTM